MNRAGLQMLGLEDPSGIIGVPYLDLAVAPDRERLQRLMRLAFEGQTHHFEFCAAGATALHVKSCFVPIRDESGAVVRLMGLSENITQQKRDARELAEKSAQIKALSGHLLQLRDAEQKKLALELHERCSPNLSALQMNLRLIADVCAPGADVRLTALLEDSASLLADTVASVRNLASGLRLTALDHAGLGRVLHGYVEQFRRCSGLRVDLCDELGEGRLPDGTEISLFRIAQEALSNCLNHAQARAVCIRMARSPGWVHLTIRDNGRGFDLHDRAVRVASGGHGLLVMRERAELAGGRFSINSAPGQGTCVSVSVPG
jgi:signal transduction histidine kinase